MPEPTDIQDVLDGEVPHIKINATSNVLRALLPTSAQKSALGNLGSASTRAVPASGNAGTNEVVLGSDTRLGAHVLGDVGGLTSAQIDSLFPSTPGNGALATGLVGTTPILLMRRDDKWCSSAAYTQIA